MTENNTSGFAQYYFDPKTQARLATEQQTQDFARFTQDTKQAGQVR